MSWQLSRPTLCPIMVGRESVLQIAEHALEQALAGRGCTLFITGEAGIGKSRLVKAVSARASERGLRILQSGCFETNQASPYAPALDLLQTFCAAVGAQKVAASLGAQ